MGRARPPRYLGAACYLPNNPRLNLSPPIAHRYADYQPLFDHFLLHRWDGSWPIHADRLELTVEPGSVDVLLRDPASGLVLARRNGLEALVFTHERMHGYTQRTNYAPCHYAIGKKGLWRPAIAMAKYFRHWGKHLDLTWTHDLRALQQPLDKT